MDDSYTYVPAGKPRIAVTSEVTKFAMLPEPASHLTIAAGNPRIVVKLDDPHIIVVRKVRYP